MPPHQAPANPHRSIALSLGQAAGNAEQAALTLATARIYRFRRRHPWLYGLAAFIAGGGLLAVFTMTTYKDITFQSIDLTVALYQVIAGGFGGGIVAVILAFAYARAIQPTLEPMRSGGIIGAAGSATVPPRPGQ